MALKDQIKKLSAEMHKLGTGPLAELRRMDIVHGPGPLAFWQLAKDCGFIDDEQRTSVWMQIVKIMAILTPKGEPGNRPHLHDEKCSLGAALGDGNGRPLLSETRLARFLSQRPDQRAETLERIARMLSRTRDSARGVNCVEIANLLLFPENKNTLQNLARAYYQRLDHEANRKETTP